jgi:hypothetical protein
MTVAAVRKRPGLMGARDQIRRLLIVRRDWNELNALPQGERKAQFARLLARSSAGIVFNEHTDESCTLQAPLQVWL